MDSERATEDLGALRVVGDVDDPVDLGSDQLPAAGKVEVGVLVDRGVRVFDLAVLAYIPERTGISYGLMAIDAVGAQPPTIVPIGNNSGGTTWQRLAP